MQARTFAEGYRGVLTSEQIHSSPPSALIREAQTWSYKWGLALHARLSGQTIPINPEKELSEYTRWVQTDFASLSNRINTSSSDEVVEARNELNFHWLTMGMLPMWAAILEGQPELGRGRWLHVAQENLALRGLILYGAREQFVKTHNSHLLFEPSNEKNYASFTGNIQELDASIALLDILNFHPDPRRRNITIVPAPLQFERSDLKSRNVDFVVFDQEEDQAVGVQVKTGVTKEDYANCDSERVVFLDGKVDLDNVRPMRIRKGQSYERIVPWPGIISAKRVQGVKTHGGELATRFAQTGVPIHKLKLEARRLVGDIRVDRIAIAKRVGDRVLAKLYQ